jgi:hypothetical protein
VWSLPFLSTLAPSERYAKETGKRHKKLTEWAWQLLLQLRRWQPEREIVAVADGTYAALELLDRCRRLSNPITFITRLRLDAALYEPAQPRLPGQMGRPRLKGERMANLSAIAEDPSTGWEQIMVANCYSGGQRTVEHRVSVDALGRDLLAPTSLQSLVDAHDQRTSFWNERLHHQPQVHPTRLPARPAGAAQDPMVAVESLLLV